MAKKASGRNVRESERSTVRLVLRVPPDVAEDLDELSARWRLTRSGTVARLLEERTDQHKSLANSLDDSERNEG